jgi:DNA helicase MCM9
MWSEVDQVVCEMLCLRGGVAVGQEEGTVWGVEKMRGYLSYVKRLKPAMSSDANRVLSQYYQLQRQAAGRSAARTTIRLLESLVRLAQAHARLMCHSEVTLMDAVVAVSVMECSLQSSALLGGVNVLHSAFPDDADLEYSTQKNLILNQLDLTDVGSDDNRSPHGTETSCHGTGTSCHGMEHSPPAKRHCSRDSGQLDITTELL